MNNEKAILLRLSKEDKQTIKDLAKSKRMSMTGYIRNEILKKNEVYTALTVMI